MAFTHGGHYGEEYFSFVNGQHTTMGGTHLSAFREALTDTIRNFFKQLRKAAREGAACTRSVYRAIGRKPRCGQCLPFAKEIIAAERATA